MISTYVCIYIRPFKVTADTRDELSEEAGNVSKEEGDGNLVCPICGVEYERNPENARKLVLHVDEHLIDELKCPICSIAFSVRNQNAYENHVNVSTLICIVCIFTYFFFDLVYLIS